MFVQSKNFSLSLEKSREKEGHATLVSGEGLGTRALISVDVLYGQV